MRPDEFETWLPNARKAYATDMIESGGLEAEAAHAKAEIDFATLLSAGVESADQSLYMLVDGGEVVGDLWIAERDDNVGRILFVFDVHVRESLRGRGYGKAAMGFVEEEARRRGIPRVALNVFGGNAVARGLYRSLGYNEVAVWMDKHV